MPEFIPRNLPEDELSYDPKTLEKKNSRAGSKPVGAPPKEQIIATTATNGEQKRDRHIPSDGEESPCGIEPEAALASEEIAVPAENDGGDDSDQVQIENSLVVGGF